MFAVPAQPTDGVSQHPSIQTVSIQFHRSYKCSVRIDFETHCLVSYPVGLDQSCPNPGERIQNDVSGASGKFTYCIGGEGLRVTGYPRNPTVNGYNPVEDESRVLKTIRGFVNFSDKGRLQWNLSHDAIV